MSSVRESDNGGDQVPVIDIGLIEDCAGIGTGYAALQGHVKFRNRRKGKSMRVRAQHIYSSEKIPALRKYMQVLHNLKKKDFGDDATQVPAKIGKKPQWSIYTNGSPCQPWSKIGSGDGLRDTRANALKSSVAMIRRYKPDVFIYEQVKNFKSKSHVNVKNKLVKKLKSITRICPGKAGSKAKKRRIYHLTEKILKTCEVASSCIEKPPPQIRERFFWLA